MGHLLARSFRQLDYFCRVFRQQPLANRCRQNGRGLGDYVALRTRRGPAGLHDGPAKQVVVMRSMRNVAMRGT